MNARETFCVIKKSTLKFYNELTTHWVISRVVMRKYEYTKFGVLYEKTKNLIETSSIYSSSTVSVP